MFLVKCNSVADIRSCYTSGNGIEEILKKAILWDIISLMNDGMIFEWAIIFEEMHK